MLLEIVANAASGAPSNPAVAQAIAAAIAPSSTGEIATHLPYWMQIVSLAGGIAGALGFVWKLIEFVQQRRDRSSDRHAKILDVWFSSVITPRCTVPLCDFIAERQRAFDGIDPQRSLAGPDPYKSYQVDFELRINAIYDAIGIIQVFNQAEYVRIRNRLEVLGDRVTIACAISSGVAAGIYGSRMKRPPNVNAELTSCLQDVLTILLHLHIRATNSTKAAAVSEVTAK